MKKLLLFLGILAVSAVSSANERSGPQIEGRVVWGFNKEYDNDYETDSKGMEFSEIGVEFRQAGIGNLDNLELGIGGSLMYDNGTRHTVNDYSSIPLYGVARYNIVNINGNIMPYVKGHLGYSINSLADNVYNSQGDYVEGDMKGGLYYGVGVGVELYGFTVELMYRGINAEFKQDDKYDYYDGETKANKTSFGLSVGVNIGCVANPAACYQGAFTQPDYILVK